MQMVYHNDVIMQMFINSISSICQKIKFVLAFQHKKISIFHKTRKKYCVMMSSLMEQHHQKLLLISKVKGRKKLQE